MQGFDEYMNLVLDDAEELSVKRKTRKSLGKLLPYLTQKLSVGWCLVVNPRQTKPSQFCKSPIISGLIEIDSPLLVSDEVLCHPKKLLGFLLLHRSNSMMNGLICLCIQRTYYRTTEMLVISIRSLGRLDRTWLFLFAGRILLKGDNITLMQNA
jgi:hypothetical protein